MREAAAEAIEQRPLRRRPAFLETLTYRFVGHSRSDPGKYRKPGELDEWRKRDPLPVARARLLEERYGIEAERCDEIDAEVAKRSWSGSSSRGWRRPFPIPPSDGKEFKDG